MHPRTLISFVVATGLHAAGFAALDAGWLLPSPKPEPVRPAYEVELATVTPETPAVPLPVAPEAPPKASQNPEPMPAPVAEPPPAAAKAEPEPPPPPKPLPPEPKVERHPEPKPEPPPPPKPAQRPKPGPMLESKPRPAVPVSPPKRVATAKPPSSAPTGSPGGGGAGSRTTTVPSGPASPGPGGYGTGALLAIPGYLSNPKPPYPARAKREKQQGVVLLNVDVNAEGDVTHVEIARSSGHILLDESALTTVRRWRFKPARLGDHPIDSRVQVPVRFQFGD